MLPGNYGRFRSAELRVGERRNSDDDSSVKVKHIIYYAADRSDEATAEDKGKRTLFVVNLPLDWTQNHLTNLFGHATEWVSEHSATKMSYPSGYREPPAMPKLYTNVHRISKTGAQAHIMFKDDAALASVLESGPNCLTWDADGTHLKQDATRLGYKRYLLNHQSSTPPLDQIQAHASSWLETYESLSSVPLIRPFLGFGQATGPNTLPEDVAQRLSSGALDLLTPADLRRFQQSSAEASKRSIMEEDGFTVVGFGGGSESDALSKNERRKGFTKDPAARLPSGFIAGGAAGRGTAVVKAARRDIVALRSHEDDGVLSDKRKRKARKKEGLEDFYKFQINQNRPNELKELRRQFALDKVKAASMKHNDG